MQNLRETVEEMISRFVTEIGLTKEQTYNEERRAWYWNKGSAKIEVFVQEIKFEKASRFYLRIFSPIGNVPSSNRESFYKKLLEMNDGKLGVKITIMPNSDQIYATYERDVKGMDYDEMVTCIADLEYWADILDNELVQTFAGGKPPIA
jgi:hypothetical protein